MNRYIYFLIGFLGSITLALVPVFVHRLAKNANNPPTQTIPSKLPSSGEADIFLASRKLPIFPVRNWKVPDPDLKAKIVLVYDLARKEILFEKNNINEKRPIASLTKLVTALVVLDNTKLDDIFEVSQAAAKTPYSRGKLQAGEKFTVRSLLYAMLVESNNAAAQVLAEGVDRKISSENESANEPGFFVALMNKKAQSLGLANTSFSDPSGLDEKNVSTAMELMKIMNEFLKHPVLTEITKTPSVDLISVDGQNRHFESTNKLLGRIPEIAAGKTGYTEEAGNCMILALRLPKEDGMIVTIVMEAGDRMAESETLINWTKKAFLW